jgi:hypothetical protein
MEEDQNRWKLIPRSEKKIQRERERERERNAERSRNRRRREDNEIKEIRTEKEVWKCINCERKKNESVSEEITMQIWEEYFMKLLEGGRKEERQKQK